MHESQMHKANCFITLTYNNENLPTDGGLHLDDWQKFAKRLRKNIGPFRFYHCGEYGEDNLRPHYHAAIFGLDFTSDRELWLTEKDRRTYISSDLSRLWGKGFCTIGDLTFASAAYIARYLMKKQDPDQEVYIRTHEECEDAWLVKPEYATMSRGGTSGKGGLATSWINKYKSDVFPSDQVINDQGRAMRTPKFYDQFLTEEEKQSVKEKRAREAKKHTYDQTPRRLAVRERVTQAKIKQLKRSL